MSDLGERISFGPSITHPERIVYEKDGISKKDVADYYRAVAKWMLPELVGRPLSLVRCPDGAQGECFFQKHHDDSMGESVKAIPLQQKTGREEYLYIEDIDGLLELVQMNSLEFHSWGSRVEAPEKPDRLVFDLDPGPGVAWPEVKAAARDIRRRLRAQGMKSFLRLTGGKGLHVVVPIMPGPGWKQARDFCAAFANNLSACEPGRYVASMSKAKRNGVIFVDWLRNGRGATSIGSWSLRARAGHGRDAPALGGTGESNLAGDVYPGPRARACKKIAQGSLGGNLQDFPGASVRVPAGRGWRRE